MKWRAEWEDILKQVEKDTTEVCGEWGIGGGKTTDKLSVSHIIDVMRGTFSLIDHPTPMHSTGEVKDALMSATTNKDWTTAAGMWLIRLLYWEKNVVTNHYTFEHTYEDGSRLSSIHWEMLITPEGLLSLELSKRIDTPNSPTSMLFHREMKSVFKLEGKPSRVLTKLMGEKFATACAQNGAFTAGTYELKFAKHYLPEIYIQFRVDENCNSCMSYASEKYGLAGEGPNNTDLHPMMAYEGSENAVLALLWCNNKNRAVARAMAFRNGGRTTFCTSYGMPGRVRKFKELGLSVSSETNGLHLVRIEDSMGNPLLPYVDGDTQHAEDHGSNGFYISPEGDLEPNHETGRPLDCQLGTECACCGDYFNEDDMIGTHNDGLVCEGCRDYRYVWCVDIEDYVNELDSYYYVAREDENYYNDSSVFYNDLTSEYDLQSEMVTVKIHGGSYLNIHEDEVEEAMERWRVVEIDGEPVEREEEEAA